jgi:hypothetical protein
MCCVCARDRHPGNWLHARHGSQQVGISHRSVTCDRHSATVYPKDGEFENSSELIVRVYVGNLALLRSVLATLCSLRTGREASRCGRQEISPGNPGTLPRNLSWADSYEHEVQVHSRPILLSPFPAICMHRIDVMILKASSNVLTGLLPSKFKRLKTRRSGIPL